MIRSTSISHDALATAAMHLLEGRAMDFWREFNLTASEQSSLTIDDSQSFVVLIDWLASEKNFVLPLREPLQGAWRRDSIADLESIGVALLLCIPVLQAKPLTKKLAKLMRNEKPLQEIQDAYAIDKVGYSNSVARASEFLLESLSSLPASGQWLVVVSANTM